MIDVMFLITTLSVPSVFSVTNDILLNVTVVEGKKAILPCRISGDGDYQVIWMNPKKILLSSKESRYIDDPRMSIERPQIGDWNLHIRNVKYEDRGEYTCSVNTPNVETRRVKLIVLVPPEIVDYLSSDDLSVNENDQVKLKCNATGKPPPRIMWYRRNGTRVIDKEQVGTEGEVLIIHNISRYCGGIYQCEADNQVLPIAVRQMTVDVQFPPEVALRNKKLGQYLGKETILVCSVTASPQGVNLWKKENKEISPDVTSKGIYSSNYRTEVYTENYYTVCLTLRILVITPKDFGNYTCEASNSLGTTAATMQLYEYKNPSPIPATKKTPESIINGPIIWEDYTENENPVYNTNIDKNNNNRVIDNGNAAPHGGISDESHKRNYNSVNNSSNGQLQSKLYMTLFIMLYCNWILTVKTSL